MQMPEMLCKTATMWVILYIFEDFFTHLCFPKFLLLSLIFVKNEYLAISFYTLDELYLVLPLQNGLYPNGQYVVQPLHNSTQRDKKAWDTVSGILQKRYVAL